MPCFLGGKILTIAHMGLVAMLLFAAAMQAAAEESWTLTHDIPLLSKWPRGGKIQEDRIVADLYRPKVDGRCQRR